MSKRVDSTATTSRMMAIGDTLSNTNNAVVRGKIDEWLSDHPEAVEKIWQLMESGLALELQATRLGKRFPRCCVRFSLVAAHMRVKTMVKFSTCISRQALKEMRKHDGKIVEKVYFYFLALEKSMPMKGGMLVTDYDLYCTQRDIVVGKRLNTFTLDDDCRVCWRFKNGVYAMVSCKDGEEVKHLDEGQLEETTHVLHRFNGKMLSLEELEVGKVTSAWFVDRNWSELSAELTHGKRVKVSLFEDFAVKFPAEFDYEAKMKAQFPQHDGTDKVGRKMQTQVMAKKKQPRRL